VRLKTAFFVFLRMTGQRLPLSQTANKTVFWIKSAFSWGFCPPLFGSLPPGKKHPERQPRWQEGLCIYVIYCTPATAPLQKKRLDLPRLHIFNMLYLILLDQIAEKIINLLFVILDGFRGQIAALAVENKFFFDGFQQHKKYTPFHGSHR